MADTTVTPVRARLVRTLGNAAAAGAVAGVIAAVAARGAMRAFVVGVGGAAEFTVGGSTAILASGLLIGAGFGMAYPLLGRVPGPVLLRGLLFGVIGLVAVQIPAFAGGIDEAVGDPRLGFALFVPVPFIYGVVTALAVAGLERRFADPADQPFGLWAGAILAGALGLLVVVGPLLTSYSRVLDDLIR